MNSRGLAILNERQPFVKLRCSEGRVYSGAAKFLREVEALKRTLLSPRELRNEARLRRTGALARPLASFDTDSR
jgi:hypothetical protein